MTTGHVFIATSLDGFIARTDHQIDWLTENSAGTEEHGYTQFIDSVDGIVMGRNTYQTVLALTSGDWPYTKPVIVLTKTLTQSDIPPHLATKVTTTNQTPTDLFQTLHQKGWTRAYIDGGKTIQSFLNEGLIQEITISTIPILIGNGIPLFGKTDEDIDLELLSAKPFASGMVQSHYSLKTPPTHRPEDQVPSE